MMQRERQVRRILRWSRMYLCLLLDVGNVGIESYDSTHQCFRQRDRLNYQWLRRWVLLESRRMHWKSCLLRQSRRLSL